MIKQKKGISHARWNRYRRLVRLPCSLFLLTCLMFSLHVFALNFPEVHLLIERFANALIPTPDKESDMLAFACEHPWGNSNLYTVHPDGSELRLIRESHSQHYAALSWSPDGIWIVLEIRYEGYRDPEGFWYFGVYSDIFRVRFDGAVSRRFTPDRKMNRSPQWSHDGASIYFYAAANRPRLRSGLYRLAVDSGNVELITQLDYSSYIISPNGLLISVLPNTTGDSSLDYSLHRDQSELRLLISPRIRRARGLYYQWAPNGERFLYHEYAGRLHVFEVETLVKEYSLKMRVKSARWAPNGRWIAIISEQDVHWKNGELTKMGDDESIGYYSVDGNLYVLDTDTGQVEEIINDIYSTGISWSPDSEWIAFVSRLHDGQLFKIKRDGTAMQQLTDLDCRVTEISWSPR